MLTDANKGITNITYNHLNLPTQVTIAGQNILYIYDAVGTKLRKTVSGITTDYAGNFVYENSVLQFFNTAEGYVEPNGTGWQYVFQYKDHLGNVRLSYADADGNGLIAQTEIREENNYYPFGLKHKGYNNAQTGKDHKYGFGNKEEQDELGLGWIDITARNYDPALGRWMNLDPLAELMRRHSPYNYAFDNPVYFIDPDGNLPIGRGEKTDAEKSLNENLAQQKKQEDVQKALGFLVDKGVVKNNEDCPSCDNKNLLVDAVIEAGKESGRDYASAWIFQDEHPLNSEPDSENKHSTLLSDLIKVSGSDRLSFKDGFSNLRKYFTAGLTDRNVYEFNQNFEVTLASGKKLQLTAQGTIFIQSSTEDMNISYVGYPTSGVGLGETAHVISFFNSKRNLIARLSFNSDDDLTNFTRTFFTKNRNETATELIEEYKKSKNNNEKKE